MNLVYEKDIKTNRENTFWAHSNTLHVFENHIYVVSERNIWTFVK